MVQTSKKFGLKLNLSQKNKLVEDPYNLVLLYKYFPNVGIMNASL